MSSACGNTVLVVLHEDRLGGATRALLRVVSPLETRGWSFAFWCSTPSVLADQLRARGHAVLGEPRLLRYGPAALRHPPGVRTRLGSVPGYLHRFRRTVASRRPALVHANSLLTLPEALVARSTRTPTLLHAHEILAPGGIKATLATSAAQVAADELVAVSAACAASLGSAGRRARVIHNGIDAEGVAVGRAERGGPLVVGCIGEIAPRKGTDLFVAAAELVAARDRSIRFRLAGDYPDDPDARWAQGVLRSAAERGIDCRGRVDTFAELAELDLLVLCSRRDPFPLVVLEAMAAGVPVVATRVDGIPEQLGDTGELVDPGDPAALAAAILGLAADPSRRSRLAQGARDRVVERFSIERQAEGLHRAYLATCRRPSGAAFVATPLTGPNRPGEVS